MPVRTGLLFAVCAALCLHAYASIKWRHFKIEDWAVNCDIPGNTFAERKIALAGCSRECYKVDKCTHFSATTKLNICRLKEGVVTKGDAVESSVGSCGIIRGRVEALRAKKPDKLTKWEKVGISVGVIGGVAAVVAVVVMMRPNAA